MSMYDVCLQLLGEAEQPTSIEKCDVPCDSDCLLTEWSEWSDCNTSCGLGMYPCDIAINSHRHETIHCNTSCGLGMYPCDIAINSHRHETIHCKTFEICDLKVSYFVEKLQLFLFAFGFIKCWYRNV